MPELFGQFYNTFKRYQPVALTGTVMHAFMWVLAQWIQKTYVNPAFNHRSKKISIYCIHGTADRESAFWKLGPRLIQDDESVMEEGLILPDCVEKIHLAAFDARGKGVKINVFADQLRQLIKQNDDQDVILIGHSRGGLVATHFAEYLAKDSGINVHGVVTICTPFSGSSLARPPFTWLSDSIVQMQPKSPYLTELTRKMNESDVPYHFFSAKNDEIVAPERCVPEDREAERIELDRHNHLSILSSHRLINEIRHCILQDVEHMLMQLNARANRVLG